MIRTPWIALTQMICAMILFGGEISCIIPGLVIPAICLVVITYIGDARVSVVSLLVIGGGLESLAAAGHLINMLDLSPKFAGKHALVMHRRNETELLVMNCEECDFSSRMINKKCRIASSFTLESHYNGITMLYYLNSVNYVNDSNHLVFIENPHISYHIIT